MAPKRRRRGASSAPSGQRSTRRRAEQTEEDSPEAPAQTEPTTSGNDDLAPSTTGTAHNGSGSAGGGGDDDDNDNEGDGLNAALEVLQNALAGVARDRLVEALEATRADAQDDLDSWLDAAQDWLVQESAERTGDGRREENDSDALPTDNSGNDNANNDGMAAALEILESALPGIPREKLVRALEVTRPSATADDQQPHGQQQDDWLDAAQTWLAEDLECDEEAAKMREAMMVSLQEEEERRAQQKAVGDMSGAELRERFSRSELLKNLFGASGMAESEVEAMMGRDDVRPQLSHYLELESKCERWWQCSRGWFEKTAREFMGTLLVPSQPPNGGTSTSAAAAGGDRGGNSAHGGLNIDGLATSLVVFLNDQVAHIEQEIFVRPLAEEATLPSIFAPFAKAEEVEIDSD